MKEGGYHWKIGIRLDFSLFYVNSKRPIADFFHLKEPMTWMRKKRKPILVECDASVSWSQHLPVFKAGALTGLSHRSGLLARRPVGRWCGSCTALSAHPTGLGYNQAGSRSSMMETTARTGNLHAVSKPNTITDCCSYLLLSFCLLLRPHWSQC